MASRDTIDEMVQELESILHYGYLNRMYDVCSLINRLKQRDSEEERLFSEQNGQTWKERVALQFHNLISRMDGASLRMLAADSQDFGSELFPLIVMKHKFLHEINCTLKSNPIFRELLFGTLKQYFKPADELYLRHVLSLAMLNCKIGSDQLEEMDKYWFETYKGVELNYEKIKDLYTKREERTLYQIYDDLLHSDYPMIDNVSPLKLAIRLGVSRHIRVLSGANFELFILERLDAYTKSRLIQWIIASNVATYRLSLDQETCDNVKLVKIWINDKRFFSSRIHIHESSVFIDDYEITKKIVPRILRKMDLCAAMRGSSTQKSVEWLLTEMCHELNQAWPMDYTYEAILTGSTAEATKTFFFDEYDFVLVQHGDRSKSYHNSYRHPR